MRLKYALTALLCMNLLVLAAKDITLIVENIPHLRPGEGVYIAGNINDWDPFNDDYKLLQYKNGYALTISTSQEYLQFKFTRGSWETVEADVLGHRIDNRLIDLKGVGDTLIFKIQGWEDIKPGGVVKLQIVDQTFGSMHNDELFVTGNFNSWNPGEEKYKLSPIGNNIYQTEIPFSGGILEYKYTRGTWNTVEGNNIGKIKNNRILVPPYEKLRLDTISTWEDLGTNKRYLLVINDIPENTPKDANIYVTGNFNNWDPGNEDYRLDKREGGYFINVESELDTLIYKFTRGDFNSVEGRFNGLARPNRITVFQKVEFPMLISIKTWEDLSGDWFNIYTISLIVPFLIGLLIILALGGLKNSQPSNTHLQLLLSVLCLGLIFRVIPYYRELFTSFPQVILLSDMVYFLYPVLSYFYVLQLFGEFREERKLKYYLHYLPFAIQFIAYLPLFLIEKDVFTDNIVNLDFQWVFRLLGFLGLISCSVYWIKSVIAQKRYLEQLNNNLSYDLSLKYTRSIIVLNGVILFLWLSLFMIGFLGFVLDLNVLPLIETTTDMAWFFFSFNVYVFGFFAIQKPELFKMTKSNTGSRSNKLEINELEILKEKLDSLMKEKKPYLDDQLSLNQLADQMGVTIHTLSRVINEGFDINFYDFINCYRVEEFIQLASQQINEDKTYLNLAIEVGFNSKSTFNRSFKKLKGVTPREFFKEPQVIA